MQWFPLQVLVLTFVCLHGALRTAATVVTAGADLRCDGVLYKDSPPVGITDSSLKKICQTYGDAPRYFTLYDPKLRIPIFSAYTIKKTDGETVNHALMYEPQLADIAAGRNMEEVPQGPLAQEVEDSQAVPDDYSTMTDYVPVRLNPVEHQLKLEDRIATFTLTNMVPQIRKLTSWRQHEKNILERLKKQCRGTAYMVTGVIPSKQIHSPEGKDRVAIPESLWSAYCCDDVNPEEPKDIRLPAQAALVENTDDAEVREMPVSDLEALIKTKLLVDSTFQIFLENCRLSS